MNYRFVAMDLDGTVLYTLPDLVGSLNYALKKNGFDQLSTETVITLIGHSVDYMCENALPGDAREKYTRIVLDDFNDHYYEHCCDNDVLYPGTLETLEELRRRGVELAVVSNKPNRESRKIISRFFPDGIFSFVIGAMGEFPKKPGKGLLSFVMNYLNFSREETLYVGDSEVDVEFARNEGVDCVSCAWGYRSVEILKESGAGRIIHHFPELLEHV